MGWLVYTTVPAVPVPISEFTKKEDHLLTEQAHVARVLTMVRRVRVSFSLRFHRLIKGKALLPEDTRFTWWLLILVSVIVLAAVRSWNPGTFVFYPRCMFFMATNMFCPGCGMSRGLHAMLHGHILEALSFNALLIFCPVLAGVALWGGVKGRMPANRFVKSLVWVCATVTLIFTALRNVPLEPFSVLSP